MTERLPTNHDSSSAPTHGLEVKEFNPLQPGWIDDPYPLYRELLEQNPVHYSSAGAWIITRYQDVRTWIADRRLSSRPSSASSYGVGFQQASSQARMRRSLLPFLDPPEHTLLRALIRQAFNAESVRELTPGIEASVTRQAKKAFVSGSCDLLEDLVRPVCLGVVRELLGVPEEDVPKLRTWSKFFFTIFDPMPSAEAHDQTQNAIDEFRDYLGWILGERRENPGSDVISRLLAARAIEQQLSANDILSTSLLVFAAGDENIVNLIGNSILALMESPAQWDLLCHFDHLPATAIEELLRFAGPAQFTGRTALEDVEIGGQRIRAGDVVLLLTACANRDPTQFENPDRLDLLRQDNNHVAFGNGRHHCLGADLTRAELRCFLDVLRKEYSNLKLDPAPLHWKHSTAVRGPEKIPVTLFAKP